MKTQILKTIALALMCLTVSSVKAQLTIPYLFQNNSEYPDSMIYVGLVGKYEPTGDVWMNMRTSALVAMSADANTLSGPIWSSPSTWTYPAIFTKLSDIQNKTIQIPLGLYACRIFISFESPMYLHFHETGGYAGANLNSSSDPNDGIRWELVELTWGTSGLWTNTSRVDAYQYPMGLELKGFQGQIAGDYTTAYNAAISGTGTPKNEKIGELLTHEDILAKWDETVSQDYLVSKIVKTHSLDGGPIIEQPSKVEAFPDDVLDDYIDEIWSTYATRDLTINIGDRGTWVGRVTNNQFNFVDPADNSIATIYGKPTSFNAIEGSGFLAYTPVSASSDIQKYNEDLMIQAQLAAAISRHAIYTDVPSTTVQYAHDETRFFQIAPYNEYVAFFHDPTISYESQTYAFAYDDVGDHSSTIQCTFPTEVKVVIGGYGYNRPTNLIKSELKNSITFQLSQSTVTLQNPSRNLLQVELLNTKGQVKASKVTSTEQTALDLSQLDAGIYFVKTIQNRQVVTRMITKR